MARGQLVANRQADYQRVAQLHGENLDQGFLSTLGPRFLSLLYQAIDECPDACLLLARDHGRVVGFVAGTQNMGRVYRQLLRYWQALGLSLVPSLLMPRRLWRILELLRYSLGGTNSATALPTLPAAELLSIAIDPAYRGRGIAEDLYEGLKLFFATRGLGEFKIIVGASLAPAHRFYRRMGAMPVAEIEIHLGASSTVYIQYIAG